MGWFRRDPPAVTTRGSSDPATSPSETVIGSGTNVTGEIRGSRAVRIEGRLEGSVFGPERVSVAEGGHVRGTIEAIVVRVAGVVEGNVQASQRFEMTATGVLVGDAQAPNVVVAEGAVVQGELRTSPVSERGAAGEGPGSKASRVR